VLKTAKAVTADQSENLSKIFRGAWNQILGKTKITEIHGDLMWRQILRTKDKRLIILDLDEHIAGHAAKDLAGLCAANRFIAENLQSPQREYLRNVAEQLNTIILESYMRNAERSRAMWAENLEKTVAVYLAYRHLHDAAYYAPVWRQARKQVDLKRYKRYVDFSLGWLEESLKLVKNHLNLE
jgi:predicted trehalose synthase